MKVVALAATAALISFAQSASAQDTVYNCEGDAQFGAVTQIKISEDQEKMRIDYIGNRARAGSDEGTRDPEFKHSRSYKLKKFKKYRVTMTSMSVRDEQGRRLRKVQIKEIDRVLGGYLTILCQEEVTETETETEAAE